MKGFDEMVREMGSAPAMPPGEAFWSDFRARARLRAQMAPPSPAVTALRWAAMASPLAAAAVLMLVLRAAPGAWAATDTEINSLEVETAHRAVFIMNDEPTRSTIVWVDCGEPGPATGAER